MIRRGRAAAALGILIALGAGCGYKLAGGNAFLPERIKVIALAPFANRTSRPEIDQRVTEEVARELSKRGGYKVVADRSGADAFLEGAVVRFQTSPVQFNAEGRAERVETVVSIEATLRDLASGQILWSQSGLQFREQYDVPQDQEGFFDRENVALDEIAGGAADVVVTSILEGF